MNLLFDKASLLQYWTVFLDPEAVAEQDQKLADAQILQRRIAAVARKDDVTLEQISRVFAADVEFCDYVMLLANRYPNLSEPVQTLNHAVMLLGTERLCRLAETQSLWRGFSE